MVKLEPGGERVADFVFLQMPDQVPARPARQQGNFRPCLLHPVFTKDALPGVERGEQRLGRMGFRDGHEFDFLRAPTGADGGGGDLRVDGGETVGDFVHLGN